MYHSKWNGLTCGQKKFFASLIRVVGRWCLHSNCQQRWWHLVQSEISFWSWTSKHVFFFWHTRFLTIQNRLVPIMLLLVGLTLLNGFQPVVCIWFSAFFLQKNMLQVLQIHNYESHWKEYHWNWTIQKQCVDLEMFQWKQRLFEQEMDQKKLKFFFFSW